MDPNQAFKFLLEAMDADDHEATSEHLCDLLEWIERGGFLPIISSDDMKRLLTGTKSLLMKAGA